MKKQCFCLYLFYLECFKTAILQEEIVHQNASNKIEENQHTTASLQEEKYELNKVIEFTVVS